MAPAKKNSKTKPCIICGRNPPRKDMAFCNRCKIKCAHIACIKRNGTMLAEVWLCKACQFKRRVRGSTSNYKEKAVTTGKVKFINIEEVSRIMVRDASNHNGY